MEQKIYRLFDYQRFAGNSRLAALIAETEGRCTGVLADDDLAFVNAAGTPQQYEKPQLKPEEAENDA